MDRLVYRVLVDGTRPRRKHGYPHPREDMKSVREDYTHAVVSREVNDHEEAKVYCYCSRLDLAEKRAKAALSFAHRNNPDEQEANPVEFLVVPLAWRWASAKWSPRYGYRWEEAVPGGLKGYTSPPPEEDWVIAARNGQRYRLFDTRRSTLGGAHDATETSGPGGTPRRPDVEAMNEREGWCRFAAIPFVVDPNREGA